MKITIEGTKEEIEVAKQALEHSSCTFGSMFCSYYMSCDECKKNTTLVKEFIILEKGGN